MSHRAFGPDVNPQVLHNQMVTRFTAGYSAINCVPPPTLEAAIKRIKSNELSKKLHVLHVPRQPAVRVL